MHTDIQVISTTLDALLKQNIDGLTGNKKLVIPEYQRPYVWKQKQILQLLEDLKAFVLNENPAKPLYYLGSIILHQSDDGLHIIDGQQRLTTLMIMQQLLFNDCPPVTYSNPSSLSRIKSNYVFLQEIFKGDYLDHLELMILKDKLNFSQMNITLVITKSEDLAYTFFETQNTGGVRLSGSDIVKAHHLRAVNNPKEIAFQARRWEKHQKNIDQTIDYLVKLRFWDNRYWRIYPFFRDWTGKKNSIIDEFSLQTNASGNDVSYYYQIVEKKEGVSYSGILSHYKQIRQPLSDGNNTLDYLNEYLKLYVDLFESQDNYQIDERFLDFYSSIVKNSSGTIFLKDLWEASIIAYVSKFGYQKIFEMGLWLYRNIYSRRVTLDRNVREDSVFKFAKEEHFIDTILDVYTIEDLVSKLKKFRYKFNTNYTEEGQSKDRHLANLRGYFGGIKSISSYKNDYDFDKDFINGILNKTNQK